MAKVCILTGRKRRSGQNRSHAMNSSKRTFGANLQKVKVIDPKTGNVKKVWLSTKALRTLRKTV